MRPTIANFAVTNLVCGSQVSVTVPDGSLPSGTMIWVGPLAAALVAAVVVGVDDSTTVEVAPREVVAAGVEFEPQPPVTAQRTAAPITIGKADPILLRLIELFCLPTGCIRGG
ncbi:MAG: hypothetical protein ABWY93_18010 [Mycobacterium sp.]